MLTHGSDHSELLPAAFAALRVPLLSTGAYAAWAQPSPPHADKNGTDRGALERALHKWFERADVSEALYLSSPDLFIIVEAALRGGPPIGPKAVSALVRYFTRMTARSTPFGLSAGIMMAQVGDQGALRLPPRSTWRRHGRLDSAYLSDLIEACVADQEIRRSLRFSINSTAYWLGDSLRYCESRAGRGGAYEPSLESVLTTPYLLALTRAAVVPVTYNNLASVLQPFTTSADDAEAYLDALIESQVLIPELQQVVSGADSLSHMIAALKDSSPRAAELSARLRQAQIALEELGRQPLGTPTSSYSSISLLLHDLPVKIETPVSFDVNLHLPSAPCVVGADVVEAVGKGVRLLYRMSDAEHNRRPGTFGSLLLKFVEVFRDRFGDGPAPLSLVVDDELGVDWRRMQGREVDLPLLLPPSPKIVNMDPGFGARDRFLLDAMVEQDSERTGTLSVDRLDLTEPPWEVPPIPAAFVALAQLAGVGPANDNGPTIQLRGVTGGSGASWLGRFCHGDDGLYRSLREHLDVAESDTAGRVFAEVVYLPQPRLGSVVSHPPLRTYEIPLRGYSSTPREYQIPLDDLFVHLVGNRVVLASKRLSREVVPRISNAHNPAAGPNLNAYVLLAILQHQDAPSLTWSWGGLQHSLFLPRVVSGNLVLAPAQWRLRPAEIAAIAEPIGQRRVVALQELRRVRSIPPYVALSRADVTDSPLLFDLENPLCVDAFVGSIDTGQETWIVEMPDPGRLLPVQGDDGSYLCEIVLPFRSQAISKEGRGRNGTTPVPAHFGSIRTYPPGSEWLYAKLYTGHVSADAILIDTIRPLMQRLQGDGAVTQWFFLRYGDPEYHLRIRMNGKRGRLTHDVLPALHDALAPHTGNGTIWRVQLDTYVPETIRYGGPLGVAIAEWLFWRDSQSVTEALTANRELGSDGTERWLMGVVSVDNFLTSLGLDPAQRLALVTQLRDAKGPVRRRQADVIRGRRAVADAYRGLRKRIDRLMAPIDEPHQEARWISPLHRLRIEAPSAVDRLAAAGIGSPSSPPLSLYGSYVHMHLNRMLRADHVAQELMIYDFLALHYRSTSARAGALAPSS
jgi:thiopeptide-type bacteriocin biosynthesis protein